MANDESLSASISLVAATVITLLLFYVRNSIRSSKKTAPLPPGPRGLPILGYLLFIGSELHKEFTKLHQLYGSIYKLRLGKKFCIVISSPSLVKEIVRDQDVIFANRNVSIANKILTHEANDIAYKDYGHEWRNLRKMFVREMMSNASLDASYDLRRQALRKAVQEVSGKIGEPIDVGDVIFRTNMSSIMSSVWGDTLEGEEGARYGTEFKKLVAEHMVIMGKPNISDFFPMLAKLDLQGIERQARELSKRFDKFFDAVIERSYRTLIESRKATKGEGNDRKDLLTLMLDIKDRQDSAMPITMIQIKANLMDIVIGSSDTTSGILEWTMAELMHHPEIMKKVCKELEEVVGLDKAVEQSHVPKLRYLEAVIKETFRVHTPVPFLVPRRPSETAIVGGYTIPKDSIIYLNVHAIHLDPEIWENPQEFRPERFLNIGEETGKFDFSGNSFHYLPFGSGRRMCAGLPLAERMLIYQAATLLHSFEWKLPAGSKVDFSDHYGLVVKKTKPLIVIPTPRLSNPDLYSN